MTVRLDGGTRQVAVYALGFNWSSHALSLVDFGDYLCDLVDDRDSGRFERMQLVLAKLVFDSAGLSAHSLLPGLRSQTLPRARYNSALRRVR